jgi:hypothetical protein
LCGYSVSCKLCGYSVSCKFCGFSVSCKLCGYSVSCKLLATVPDLDCTADVMIYVRGILSDGAIYKVSGEEIWLVFREYMLAANKKE